MIYVILKFVITALTLSCPVPGGIFTPTFTMGAVFGQLYASIIFRIMNYFNFAFMEYRGVYSIMGAAGVTASVTRTISVAMIVLELNGHLSHAVPIMVCVLVSYATSEFLRPESFFEMLANLSELDKKVSQKDNIIVRDLLEINTEYRENLDKKCLSLEDSTEKDLFDIVAKYRTENVSISAISFTMDYIPVVDSHKTRNLLFMVKLEELARYFDAYGGILETDESQEVELRITKLKNKLVNKSSTGDNLFMHPLLGSNSLRPMAKSDSWNAVS